MAEMVIRSRDQVTGSIPSYTGRCIAVFWTTRHVSVAKCSQKNNKIVAKDVPRNISHEQTDQPV